MMVFTLRFTIPALAVEPINIVINNNMLSLDTIKPITERSRIMVPIRTISEAFGLQVLWNGNTKTVTIRGLEKEVELSIGSNTAYTDDKQVQMDVPAKIINNITFVPIRFVAEALGAQVTWEERTKTAHIVSKYIISSLDEKVFKWDKDTGEVILFNKRTGTSKKIADLNYRIIGHGFLQAETTPKDNILLTFEDNYGSPHIFSHYFYIYINANSNIVRKTQVQYKVRLQHNVKYYDNNVVLTDGQMFYIIDDDTGKLTETVNLLELGLDKDTYYIEDVGDNYLLVRPNGSGLLTLIYPSDKTEVLLYKELLNQDEQKYAELNDTPFRGDRLQLIEKSDTILYFANESPLFGDNTIYKYELR